ncbi:histone methyltransferase set1 [Blastocladiella emersonii ATCC 22665]|nr:histone methyltransferase set1 [Blastocladiella emersonii ATCC 22665]
MDQPGDPHGAPTTAPGARSAAAAAAPPPWASGTLPHARPGGSSYTGSGAGGSGASSSAARSWRDSGSGSAARDHGTPRYGSQQSGSSSRHASDDPYSYQPRGRTNSHSDGGGSRYQPAPPPLPPGQRGRTQHDSYGDRYVPGQSPYGSGSRNSGPGSPPPGPLGSRRGGGDSWTSSSGHGTPRSGSGSTGRLPLGRSGSTSSLPSRGGSHANGHDRAVTPRDDAHYRSWHSQPGASTWHPRNDAAGRMPLGSPTAATTPASIAEYPYTAHSVASMSPRPDAVMSPPRSPAFAAPVPLKRLELPPPTPLGDAWVAIYDPLLDPNLRGDMRRREVERRVNGGSVATDCEPLPVFATVSSIDPRMSAADVKTMFLACGPIIYTRLETHPTDPAFSLGIARIKFATEQAARICVSRFDGRPSGSGRFLHVELDTDGRRFRQLMTEARAAVAAAAPAKSLAVGKQQPADPLRRSAPMPIVSPAAAAAAAPLPPLTSRGGLRLPPRPPPSAGAGTTGSTPPAPALGRRLSNPNIDSYRPGDRSPSAAAAFHPAAAHRGRTLSSLSGNSRARSPPAAPDAWDVARTAAARSLRDASHRRVWAQLVADPAVWSAVTARVESRLRTALGVPAPPPPPPANNGSSPLPLLAVPAVARSAVPSSEDDVAGDAALVASTSSPAAAAKSGADASTASSDSLLLVSVPTSDPLAGDGPTTQEDALDLAIAMLPSFKKRRPATSASASASAPRASASASAPRASASASAPRASAKRAYHSSYGDRDRDRDRDWPRSDPAPGSDYHQHHSHRGNRSSDSDSDTGSQRRSPPAKRARTAAGSRTAAAATDRSHTYSRDGRRRLSPSSSSSSPASSDDEHGSAREGDAPVPAPAPVPRASSRNAAARSRWSKIDFDSSSDEAPGGDGDGDGDGSEPAGSPSPSPIPRAGASSRSPATAASTSPGRRRRRGGSRGSAASSEDVSEIEEYSSLSVPPPPRPASEPALETEVVPRGESGSPRRSDVRPVSPAAASPLAQATPADPAAMDVDAAPASTAPTVVVVSSPSRSPSPEPPAPAPALKPEPLVHDEAAADAVLSAFFATLEEPAAPAPAAAAAAAAPSRSPSPPPPAPATSLPAAPPLVTELPKKLVPPPPPPRPRDTTVVIYDPNEDGDDDDYAAGAGGAGGEDADPDYDPDFGGAPSPAAAKPKPKRAAKSKKGRNAKAKAKRAAAAATTAAGGGTTSDASPTVGAIAGIPSVWDLNEYLHPDAAALAAGVADPEVDSALAKLEAQLSDFVAALDSAASAGRLAAGWPEAHALAWLHGEYADKDRMDVVRDALANKWPELPIATSAASGASVVGQVDEADAIVDITTVDAAGFHPPLAAAVAAVATPVRPIGTPAPTMAADPAISAAAAAAQPVSLGADLDSLLARLAPPPPSSSDDAVPPPPSHSPATTAPASPTKPSTPTGTTTAGSVPAPVATIQLMCARTREYVRPPMSVKAKYLPRLPPLSDAERERAVAQAGTHGRGARGGLNLGPPDGSSGSKQLLLPAGAASDASLAAALDGGDAALLALSLSHSALKSRAKRVKIARSGIHAWGLYALEPIDAGDFVIEYVGEIVRQKVADLREAQYDAAGLGGASYLFRLDDDRVVDATRCGNYARFINHCCEPNCLARIIVVDGEKKIVIYAARAIAIGDEITYDYKFEIEEDDEAKIKCLCGAKGCRGSLN